MSAATLARRVRTSGCPGVSQRVSLVYGMTTPSLPTMAQSGCSRKACGGSETGGGVVPAHPVKASIHAWTEMARFLPSATATPRGSHPGSAPSVPVKLAAQGSRDDR